MEGVKFTEERRIETGSGDVLHVVKRDSEGFVGFGEAYFSWIEPGSIKGWKRHRAMTLNLAVPLGSVKFRFLREGGSMDRSEFILGAESYGRLTVQPGIWFSFEGLQREPSLILNIADMPHDEGEVERRPLDAFELNIPDIQQ